MILPTHPPQSPLTPLLYNHWANGPQVLFPSDFAEIYSARWMSPFLSISAPDFSQLLMAGRKKLGGGEGGLTLPPPVIFCPKLLWDFQWEKMDLNSWDTGHRWEARIHLERFLWDCECCLFYMQNSHLISSDLVENYENSFHAFNLE